jgi:hypothetical protein
MLVLAGLIAVSACENEPLSNSAEESVVQAQAPADGNGNKQVITFNEDVPDPLTCPNGAELRLNFRGWVQVKLFENSRRVELDVWHTTHTWTNAAGETFVDREIGPDRYYLDRDGNLILSITGHSPAFGVMGQIVINLTTGEVVKVTGPSHPDHLTLACEALT